MTDRLTATAGRDYSDLIGSLGLAARVRLLTGASTFTLQSEPSIGLGELRLSDGPTGVRGLRFTGGPVVCLFPNATLLASSWDETALREVGRMLAEEAMAQEIHVVLGPTINLHRSALGGRLFEAYSEDPLLTGRLAAAYVHGLQGSGVGACLKHLVANESETERHTVSSVVDEATLREVYLLPFEIAVADADPWSIMAAYNDVNGVAATEQHHVNTEIVKGEWGYSGLIMSDWFATKTVAPAANGGLDLVMPGPVGPWGDALVEAVRRGEVAESVIDEHARRLLRLADRVGALAEVRSWPGGLPEPTSPIRREQLTRLAARGMTVLTNRDQALPLARTQTVALIGRHAVDTIGMGGGSAQVNAPYQVSLAAALTGKLSGQVSVTDGVEVRTRPVPAAKGFVADPVSGAPGVRVTLLDAEGAVIQDRVSDSSTVLVGFDDDFPQTVATVRLRARVDHVGPVEVGGMGAGSWRMTIGDDDERPFELSVSGVGMGEEILNPPRTVVRHPGTTGESPLVVDATVVLGGGPAGSDGGPANPLAQAGMFGLIARPAARDQDEVIAEAVAAAHGADVAVVVVGLTAEQETEAVDKDTLRLPGRQDDLVRAVAGVAPHTVVVVNAATPVLMPWVDEVDAVLWAGLPGQEAGHAIAAALLGDIEPAGRLVTTFPTADGATPAWSVTPIDGRLPYTEGPFIGYRGHHSGRAPAPAFWFGHGLGYTTWEYSGAVLHGTGQAPQVEVTVTNTGSRAGREVVQVYVEPGDAEQPVRLVGWSAVDADPGQSRTVTVASDPRLWRVWDQAAGAWSDLPRTGRILVARGLGDVRAVVPLN